MPTRSHVERYLADRAVIRLSPGEQGEDVVAFLQGLVTNDISSDWQTYTALLTPQGKVLFDFFVEREYASRATPGPVERLRNPKWFMEPGFEPTGDVLIDCEAARAEPLVKRLLLYRLRRKINIMIDTDLCVMWPIGWHDGWPDPRFPQESHLGIRFINPCRQDMVDASAEYRAQRLMIGVTEGLAELGDGTTLWLECNAAELNGVSFTKGCYIGQENTARMNWRQKVNRRLVVVPLAQADPARQRIAYPDLGWSVEHRRVEDMHDLPLPEWQRAAIAPEIAAGDTPD
jgi:hypothetical protein